jgi:hypothetical protein
MPNSATNIRWYDVPTLNGNVAVLSSSKPTESIVKGTGTTKGQYAEFGAALTMFVPFFVSLWFYRQPDSRTATKLAGLGCMLHVPFSMALHVYRGTYNQDKVRTYLYKLDVAFMHVNMVLVGYAWGMRVQYHQLVYHGVSLMHLAYVNPLINPRVKNRIDVIVACCFVETWLGLLFRSWQDWVTCLFVSSLFFLIHNQQFMGRHSSSVIHVMVALPEFLAMRCLQENIEPQWGYM